MASPTVFDAVLGGVETRVTTTMNDELMRPFEAGELQFALKQMDVETALGSDGFHPLFYKKFWNKVGMEVLEAVLTALNVGTILANLNHTFLNLISKVQSPRQVIDFRPISLSNVLYKLIAKVLANCLKPLLPNLISETQSEFM